MFFMRIENYSNHHKADTLIYSYHIFLTRWGVFSLTERTYAKLVGYIFLSQSAQSSLRFLAHISSPQNAFGIQSSQRPFN